MPSLCRFLSFAILMGFAPAAVCVAKPDAPSHVYKSVDGRDLVLYVTEPAGEKPKQPRPAIVFFHGGGWLGGEPGQFSSHSEYFASRGVVCFQVQYRLLDRKSKTPPVDCVQDAKSAMRWIRARSEQFGIDPNRIASAGGSAGGHLAAFVGCVDGGDAATDDRSVSAKSQAMLLFNPVYDNGPGGWGTARVGDRYQEFSPAHNLSKDDPPSIVFLGSEDRLIPVATAEKFRDDSLAVGVDSELHVYQGQGHGFFNVRNDDGRWYRKTVVEADRFLNKLGWIDGPPTLQKP
ncbi:Carboxylesterase NlhH [Rosistilla carotiformis]|uniref:Carboxylesterase NlhH n=1 Tax=Rosistilla carotiformis TaxID=2528017 RepID=A0A518JUY2_9BACT|nr:alpha/beta hydrolase [Rosistilla carotiformis]QDV69349.1 Carboxylesterase NlhH [Rosistilla carotiformis]